LSEYSDQELAAERAGLPVVPGSPEAWPNFMRCGELDRELEARFQARLDEGPLNRLEIERWGELLGAISLAMMPSWINISACGSAKREESEQKSERKRQDER
jgi:hypothetical protein